MKHEDSGRVQGSSPADAVGISLSQDSNLCLPDSELISGQLQYLLTSWKADSC